MVSDGVISVAPEQGNDVSVSVPVDEVAPPINPTWIEIPNSRLDQSSAYYD